MPAFPKNRVVRLKGKALDELRHQCWERAKGRSEKSGVALYWQPRFDGDPLAYDMAHIRPKALGGDVLSNVRALSHEEHVREHTEGKQ